VAGVGRSGTSATARVLHESGVRLGHDFYEPDEFNSTGYYQEREIYTINQSMMAEAGMGDLNRHRTLPWRSVMLAAGERFTERMQRAVASSDDGWKDGLFSFTLEAWLVHLPQPLKIVVCLRNPEAYARSVMNIYGLMDQAVVLRFWARHYQRLLEIVRDYGIDAFCLQYEELIGRPTEAIRLLSEFVGRPLDASLVRTELKRFSGEIPPQYQELYDAVCALGGTPQLPPRADLPDLPADPKVYRTSVRELTDRLLAARNDWLAAIGAPEPRFDGAATHDASSAYADAARDAQEALRRLEPPPDLEPYHDATRSLFDHERLTAYAFSLVTPASQDAEHQKNARYCWDTFSAPEVFEKALRERER
jgi:hypothetical protein